MQARDARADGVLRQALRFSTGQFLTNTERPRSTTRAAGILALAVVLMMAPQTLGATPSETAASTVAAKELPVSESGSLQTRLARRAEMRALAAQNDAPAWSEHVSASALAAKDAKRFGFNVSDAAAGTADVWGHGLGFDDRTPVPTAQLDLSQVLEKGVADCDWQPGYGIPGLDGPVFALTTFDDGSGEALFAGGRFLTAGGVLAPGIAKWDGTAWSDVDGGVDGIIWALTVFDDGTGDALYAGGFFSTAGATPASSIAKWDGTAWTALGLGIDIDVYALEVFDDGGGDALFVGGFFFEAGGAPADNIAKWDGTSWSTLGLGTDEDVEDLTVFDDGGGDALFATGFFMDAGGITVYGVAKWDGATWSDLDTGLSDPGLALTTFDDGSGTDLYVGGLFFDSGSTFEFTPGIARWDGTVWSGLDDGIGDPFFGPGVVDDLIVFDDGGGDALFVGGFFFTADGQPAENIAKWDGAAWSTTGLATGAPVVAFTVFDDGGGADLIAGGFFREADGVVAQGIAEWDGTTWSALAPTGDFNGLDEKILAFALFDDGSGEALYAGGEFLTANGVLAPGIAKWDGSDWSPLGDGVECLGAEFPGGMLQPGDGEDKGIFPPPRGSCLDASVIALAVYDDGTGPALFVGGVFDLAGGVPVANIAKWDGTSWSDVGLGTDDTVESMVVYDDGLGEDLYIGGEFDFVGGGLLATHIAQWDGTDWSDVGGGTDDDVETLGTFDDGTGEVLIAGGEFNDAGGVAADYIASWDGTTWAPLGVGVDDEVETMTVFDDGTGDALFVGGDFLAAGGAPAAFIAKWDGTSWSPLGAGLDDEVNVVYPFDAGDGTQLYVGGFFTAAGGAPASGIARWDGTTWAPLGLGIDNPFVDFSFYPWAEALMGFDDGSGLSLYVGGDFITAGGLPSTYFAEWACPTLDYGDAPDPTYATLFASDGARHDVVSGFFLGSAVDAELDGLEDVAAAGDDVDGSDDEDGVTIGTLVAGATVPVDVEASLAGELDAWIDWNADGDFDSGEKVFDGEDLAAGTNNLSVTVPSSAVVGNTFARFRLTSAGITDPSGRAPDGEVEDYQVAVNAGAVFSITDVMASEGNGGTTSFMFTVSRNHNLSAASVDVATADGTAVAGSDYTAVPLQTVNFTAGGSLSQTVTVLVMGDTTVELDETFAVNLSSPVAGTIGGGIGAGTIVNDDSTTVTISDASRSEAAGTLFFRVELSAPLDVAVSVDVSTVDDIATTADGDYAAVSSQTVTFPAGNLLQGLSVMVNNDSTVELTESFDITLSGLVASGRSVSLGADGTGTIVNDDSAVASVSTESQLESVSPMVFTVTLSNPVDTEISMTAAALDGTATDLSDFIDPHFAPVSVTAGATSGTFNITILNDSTVELDEGFTTVLGSLIANGRAVTLGAGGSGTIENDDVALVAIGDVSQEEAAGAMSFTVSLSNPVDVATSVNVSTANGTATTADGDFDAVSSQTVDFAAGATSATVDVTVNDDSVVEPDETFMTTLTALVDGGRDVTLGSGGTGTIENDDEALLTINDVGFDEGNGGSTAFVFTVTMSNESSVSASVGYTTTDGTAEDEGGDGDYTSVSGTLTFAPGVTQQTVNVTVGGDTMEEPTEDFFVDLSGPTGATLSDSRGVGTITDDDDEGPPAVASVDSGGNTVEDCEEVRQAVSSLTVTFDQAMRDLAGDDDPGDVTNPDNYRLFMAGPNNDLDTEICGDPVGDDLSITIDAVIYDAGAFTASVELDGGAALTSAPFRFLACDTLVDGAGNNLDGGDFVRTFRIERDNLFFNGQFDCDIETWSLASTLPEEITYSEDDVDDAAISGSSAITNLSASTGFTLGQCVSVSGEASFTESAAVQVSAAPGVEVSAGLVCEFFLSEDCANDVIATAFEVFPVSDTAGAWVRIESELASPAGASSALCVFDITTPDGDSFDARVDDLTLLRPGILFEDGFEAGDTSAWTSTR